MVRTDNSFSLCYILSTRQLIDVVNMILNYDNNTIFLLILYFFSLKLKALIQVIYLLYTHIGVSTCDG